MNTKAQYYLSLEKGLTRLTAEDLIRIIIKRLIESLYKPDIEYGLIVDFERLQMFGIKDKGINWYNLSVNEIHKDERDRYVVILYEAGPEQCPTLCSYIEQHMAAWGWEITVKTEW